MMPVLQLNPRDNVAIAREAMIAGDLVADGVVAAESIPAGHKVALCAIADGEAVLKYGQRIGVATREIAAGEWVHTQNLGVGSGSVLVGETAEGHIEAETSVEGGDTFLGYLRANGRVGTRNYIGILTTVNCSATAAKRIAAHFTAERLGPYPHVDGLVALTHSTGCGMSGDGEAAEVLRRTTAGYANHPNFAGVLLLGLGCEANQVSALVPLTEGASVRATTIQDEGGTRQAIARGIAEVEALLPIANGARRTPQPMSALVVGLQCGGSDAWSGVTANPALGLAVDRLIAQGGTAILSETPEIFGAEHLLTSRSSPQIAAQLRARIAWWQRYMALHGNELDNNPSPGNKAGGLTTILEKSLGAVAKAGSSPLREVVEYAQPVTRRGLAFMDSPGYDPVSATGQIASGANLICFTTGRGSVFGAAAVPSLKLASNSMLYKRMSDDMDVNCGTILDGSESLEQVARRIYAAMVATASGKPTLSEELGFGEAEFQPWILSAVL